MFSHVFSTKNDHSFCLRQMQFYLAKKPYLLFKVKKLVQSFFQNKIIKPLHILHIFIVKTLFPFLCSSLRRIIIRTQYKRKNNLFYSQTKFDNNSVKVSDGKCMNEKQFFIIANGRTVEAKEEELLMKQKVFQALVMYHLLSRSLIGSETVNHLNRDQFSDHYFYSLLEIYVYLYTGSNTGKCWVLFKSLVLTLTLLTNCMIIGFS